jgi:predicted unusual protein kinase regulating ubiquinone biosynthesis (AarF/ABC1/UbiB family)
MLKTTLRNSNQSQVPESRGMRLLKLGQMAGGMAGGVLSEGLKRMVSGGPLNSSTLLLTPANAKRLSDQLAELRGATMKLGQLISMEAGDLLPAEFSQLLARLREDAHQMPLGQVAKVLENNWGDTWDRRFKRFNFTPLAAASIGQVHEAITREGHHLAIKIQYPGIRRSIDSDVDNVATLLRLFRLIPQELNVAELLEEAKCQLHLEADYRHEAASQAEYAKRLDTTAGFRLPSPVNELTTDNVLAMDYLPGKPLDQLTPLPVEKRDDVAHRLVWLALQEVFRWGVVQTDPNFANYRYDNESDLLGLLDFGAVRRYEQHRLRVFNDLLYAALEDNAEQLEQTTIEVGYLDQQAPVRYRSAICGLLHKVTEPIRYVGHYDFANSDLITTMSEQLIELRLNQRYWHLPPVDVLMLHRKLTGLYLACTRLKARVNVRDLAIDICT